MILVPEISDLIMEAISLTVFGVSSGEIKINLKLNGETKELTLGLALKTIFNGEG